MGRNRRTADQDAHIVVTDAAGAVKILIRPGPNHVVIAPTTGQTQVVTIGDTAARQDQRTPQVIFANQQGGGSQYWYTETEGIDSYTDSDCDARYPGMITLPPGGVQLGSTISQPITTTLCAVAEPTGLSGAPYIFYVRQEGYFRNYLASTSNWNTTAIINVAQHCYFRTYLILAAQNGANGLYHSTDGITFTNVARAKSLRGCCTHDNKLYVFNSTDSTLDWHVDPTSATGWASSTPLFLLPGEAVLELREWRDASGRTVVYVFTSRRVVWYDEDVNIFHEFYEFGTVNNLCWPSAHTSRRDGNLYLGLASVIDDQQHDTILWFSGTTNHASPNRHGGLPIASHSHIGLVTGGRHWIFAFGQPLAAGTSNGTVWWLNDQQAMGAIVRPIEGAKVWGGGYGTGGLLVVHRNGDNFGIHRYPVPDSPALPLFASGRTYVTNVVKYHEYAYTDLGMTNMPKNARWVTVEARRPDTATKEPGLATGCEISVDYKKDNDTAWTLLGILTSAATFPAVLPFPATLGTFRQLKLRIGLSSTTASLTPVVTSVALAALRQEVRREAVTVVADLADDERDFYAGQDRAQLWQRIKGWAQPGQIVALAFAGGDDGSPPATASSYSACTVEFSEYQDSQSGPNQVTLQFTDVSAPASG